MTVDDTAAGRPRNRRAAFESLVMPELPRLRATARRWVEGAANADDAVQESLLRAYRTFDAFRPGTNARAWLLTILHSVCVNERRRLQVRRVVPIQGMEDVLPSDADRETAAERNFGSSEVERLLAALPEPFRSAVTLVDVEELSYEEAAHAVGCPVGTLRSRLSRGRRALAAKLSHEAPLRAREGELR